MPNRIDRSVLEAALIGYESERQKIQNRIAELQRQLKIRNHRGDAPVDEATAKRGMSAAARKRIAAAQKKRWAAYRKKQKAG